MIFNSQSQQLGGEVYIPENVLPVSIANGQHILIEVNQDLLDICGCTESQMLGQTTSAVLTHPDMPNEIKNDIWQDLHSNRPWTGVLKFRSSNNRFFWAVMAITPVIENGSTTGYLATYRQASRQQISEAENAYYSMRNNPDTTPYRIKHGRIINKLTKKFTLSRWFTKLTIRKKLTLGLSLCIFLSTIVVGLNSWYVKQEIVDMIDDLNRLEAHSKFLSSIDRLNLDSVAQLLLALQHDPSNSLSALHDHPLSVHMENIRKNVEEAEKLRQNFSAEINEILNDKENPTSAETLQEIAKLQKIEQIQKDFIHTGLNKAVELLEKQQNYHEANALILKTLRPLYDELTAGINELNQIQKAKNLKYREDYIKEYNEFWASLLFIFIVAVLISIYISSLIIKAITHQLSEMQKTLQTISNGDYTRNVDVTTNDEIGKVMQCLQSMQIQGSYQRADLQKINNENLRVRFALHCADANMMILSRTAKIVFMNESMINHTRKLEPIFRQKNNNFNVSKIINSYLEPYVLNAIVNGIDNIENGKAIQRNSIEYENLVNKLNESGNLSVTLNIGEYTCLYNISPINDEKGFRLGTVIELIDKTAEVNAQQQVRELVKKAVAGDLEARFDLTKLEGFYRELGENFNKLLENCNSSINDLGDLLESMAEGDLTRTIDLNKYSGSFYLISKDANSSVIRLRELLNDIRDFAENINSAVIEIAAGNRDLSVRTEKQATSLQETSSSMDELTSTVCQNAESAHKANDLTQEMEKLAATGKVVVNQVVSTMGEIDQFSQHISEIIGVIDGIAFQTNILALNAAVEAARAGEQGRGFAVVASEVRSLAQRCASSAKEIKELISNAVEKIELGNSQAYEAGITTEKINESIKHVSVLITDIANASQEQSLGISQVSQAVTQMDEVTQHNTALVEQATTAAESLEEQARNLLRAVETFRLLENQDSLADSHRKSLEKFNSLKISNKNSSNNISNISNIGNSHNIVLPKLENKNADLEDEWEEF